MHKPREFEYAEVTIGGIRTGAINPDTLESYIIPGLYFAGKCWRYTEILVGLIFSGLGQAGCWLEKGLGIDSLTGFIEAAKI